MLRARGRFQRENGRRLVADPFLGRFNLESEIERLTPGDNKSGRRSEILVKTDRFRIVLMTMRAGAHLQEHSAAGPIMVQGLRGELVFTANEEDIVLLPGRLVVLEAAVKHSVRAVSHGAFLLTIGWDPSWRGEAGGAAE
jgi:quercetin dioxygenase-like cupin family protein